ncbi:HPP family protein [Labrys monachus]|uniref:CBS domain-containing membrane protein n=1 Tax=Labrys monachus TaxID=217067 RepID=A0ABU0FE58_9HYPH|nr:HPP family protein [Labrys monachus]MDQ0392811.1 CBS domain-containing membrane protein [Labrys monachus]
MPVSPSDPERQPSWKRPFHLFMPILPGATFRDRLLACFGALLGIGLTGLMCSLMFGRDPHLPFIVAPIGASSVLLFAVPSSPLAQPWSIVGGNTISALVGVAASRLVPDPMLAIGLAAGLSIAAMSLTRCLHPPGGAAALTAVIGGPAVAAAGFSFALVPVALNSIVLVLLGLAFHKVLSRHSYPHVAKSPSGTHGTKDPPPQDRTGFRAEDIDAALAELGETFDIERDDLDRLLRRVEMHAFMRSHSELTCADIMSRDVVSVAPDAGLEAAHALLLDHGIRTLPVIDGAGRLAGTVGLRELARPGRTVGDVMSRASVADPGMAALGLLGPLTEPSIHAVVIVDAENRVLGLVTQTDLLAAISHMPSRDTRLAAET